MSVGRRASARGSRGGMSEGVGALDRGDLFIESHDNVEEDCFCSPCVGVGLFFSDSRRSRNFWSSGSVSDLEEEEDVDGEGVETVDVVGGVLFSTGVDILSSLEGVEDHSQPIAMLCKW
jgi:hypothetical protein